MACNLRRAAADTVLYRRQVDFVLLAVHYYYFSRNAGGPTWFTFESTRRVPAQFGPTRWTKNGDMQLGHANAGKCAHDQQDYLSCEAPLPHNAPCGPSSGRLPLMVRPVHLAAPAVPTRLAAQTCHFPATFTGHRPCVSEPVPRESICAVPVVWGARARVAAIVRQPAQAHRSGPGFGADAC